MSGTGPEPAVAVAPERAINDVQIETLPEGRRAGPAAGFAQLYDTGAVAEGRNTGSVLTIVVLLAIAAKGLARGRIEHSWMAIRNMGVAAEIIGIRSLRTKLLAFALSSFYCGVAGAMWAFIIRAPSRPAPSKSTASFRSCS
jgi:ABC-type branched-subunit amino acid transport system permease subunit